MTRPQRPNDGTGCARLLAAMLEAYPNATWSPHARLSIVANSRASDLRAMGWDVRCIHRMDRNKGHLEYGYVLRMQEASIASARRAMASTRKLTFSERLVPAATVAETTGLSLKQLRYLDRMGSVPFDTADGPVSKYAPDSVRLLQAVGLLVTHGIGLDTALTMLRHHAEDLASAVRLVAPERQAVGA